MLHGEKDRLMTFTFKNLSSPEINRLGSPGYEMNLIYVKDSELFQNYIYLN